MATSEMSVCFPCTVERLWQAVTDLTYTAWRNDLTGVEILDDTHFVEYDKKGYATNFTVTACEPLCLWAFRMENGNMSGTWEGIFEPWEGGARLSCTETVTAKHWWMRPFVPKYLKRQQKLYMDDLRREILK